MTALCASAAVSRNLARTARDCDANARGAGWLAHAAGRLEDAGRYGERADLRGVPIPAARAYRKVIDRSPEAVRAALEGGR